MISRRALVATFGVASLPVPLRAQHSGRLRRVGVLMSTSPAVGAPLSKAFEQGLRERGYTEGLDVVYEYRWAHGVPDRLPALAAELARLPVDVIAASTNVSIVAAKRATSSIPIVMVLGVDPVGTGLVASLARPGGNVTGLTSEPGQEIFGKLLQLLKQMVPALSVVGLLTQHGSGGVDVAALRGVASRLDLRIEISDEIRGPDDVANAFASLQRRRVDGFVTFGGSATYMRRQQIADLALASRLPGMHSLSEFAHAGLLASYGPNLPELYRRAAIHVDKILKGAKPADLPVEQPTKFALTINLKTAKTLGLMIPQSLLLRADEVIE